MMTHRAKGERAFVRLTLNQRIQHAILMVSIGLLVITGFMVQGEQWMIDSLGAAADRVFWWRGIIHRVAGVAAIAVCLYHIYYIVFVPEGRSWIRDMLPRWKDAVDVFENLGYMLGRRRERPAMGRFTYLEKMEYFSVWFGVFIVITTGIMMWTEQLWSKLFLDVAGAFHLGGRPWRALAIIVGHLFSVHYGPHTYPMSSAFIDGRIGESLMKEEHPLWYETEMARLAAEGPHPAPASGGNDSERA
jgi:cytochrome b subunit of formate dehydrogenase